MATDDPDQLRRQIERTQHSLSTDVDMLAEKVTPGKVVHRKVDRARRSLTSVRDRVMGSASDGMSTAGNQIGDTASTVADRASSMASNAAETVGQAPQAIRRGAQGNPLAAGLIAFGAGWLLSSLAPATKPEQRAAGQATDWMREHSDVVTEPAAQVAQELKENLREPAEQAVDSVRSTATDAASTVADDARSAAGDVTDRAQEATSTVRDTNR
jgi:ElaB/YqjD/DUF883 family membrane-anchored ribosome-binding protein